MKTYSENTFNWKLFSFSAQNLYVSESLDGFSSFFLKSLFLFISLLASFPVMNENDLLDSFSFKTSSLLSCYFWTIFFLFYHDLLASVSFVTSMYPFFKPKSYLVFCEFLAVSLTTFSLRFLSWPPHFLFLPDFLAMFSFMTSLLPFLLDLLTSSSYITSSISFLSWPLCLLFFYDLLSSFSDKTSLLPFLLWPLLFLIVFDLTAPFSFITSLLPFLL